MSIPEVLGLLTLVVGVPLNLYVTLRLWRLHQAMPRNSVLRERGIIETAVLLLTVVFGFVFWNNDTLPPPLNLEATKLITRVVLFGVSVVPAAYWLWLYKGVKP